MDLTPDSAESLRWQEDRTADAVAHLGRLPALGAMTDRVAANLGETRVSPQFRRGGRWFQRVVLEAGAEEPVVVVRSSPTGEPRVLLDPNELTAKRGKPVALMAIEPSPDGSVVACALSEAGREENEVVLVEVQTGERLPFEIPYNAGNLAWLADSSGLIYGTRQVIDGVLECPVYTQTFGDVEPIRVRAPLGLQDARFLVSADGRHVAVATGNTEQRLDWILAEGELRPFLAGVAGGVTGAFHGDDLYALLDGGAPRGRLVRIPVATAADASTWTELVAESADVLRSVAVVGDTIVLGCLRDASSRLRLLGLDGTELGEVPLPAACTVSAWPYPASHPAVPMFVAGDDEISFICSTFAHSWAVFRYLVGERRLEVVTAPAIDLGELAVSVVTAVSADGTTVPAHVVHRADLDASVPQPTLLWGYGGYNMAYLPGFSAENAAWVQAGGVFVLAHLRGGSEFGAEWWLQGRREHKQNTFDDLYAVAGELVASGRTTRSQLVVKGESNGGLLAGVAVTQRPELWAGVVCDVPILDLIGYRRDPLTYLIGRVEYGDPAVPGEATWLRAYSPVQNVRPAAYPPVLVTAGANDPRCPAWHARVFVDLLRQAQTADVPPLLRVYADQGHGATGLHGLAHKGGEWLAFAAAAAGLGEPLTSSA